MAELKTDRRRSALVRGALRERPPQSEMRAQEALDREGYLIRPEAEEESQMWEAETTWPPE